MQNSGKTTFKRTSIDHLMNVLVLCIFGFLASMCSVLAVGNCDLGDEGGLGVHRVPPPVSPGVEIIRLGNSFFIDWDRKMYYTKSDVPCAWREPPRSTRSWVRSNTSSATRRGPLTQNIMTFNKCSINGKPTVSGPAARASRRAQQHGTEWTSPGTGLADPKFVFHDHRLVETVREGNPEAQAFFRLLALCHTVMPEEKTEGELYYQAQSPDEGALVTRGEKLWLCVPLTDTREHHGGGVGPDSPEGKLTLFCKGADTIVYERLHPVLSGADWTSPPTTST
ncbi:unnamed protein product [Lampetra planeri]